MGLLKEIAIHVVAVGKQQQQKQEGYACRDSALHKLFAGLAARYHLNNEEQPELAECS